MAKAKKKAAGAKAESKPRGQGIGNFIRELIRAGKKSTAEIVEATQKKFPDSAVKNTTVSWHRSQMRKDGEDIPRAVVKRAKKAA